MRTSIFNKFASLSESFEKDFKILWSLPEKRRNALIPWVIKIQKVRTSGKKDVEREKAIKEIGGIPNKILIGLQLLSYIYHEWNPTKDTPEKFLKDLSDLSLIPPKKVNEAKNFLLEFLSRIQREDLRRLEDIYSESIIPYYKGTYTLVDCRGIIKNPFGSTPDEDINKYVPKCVSVVPIIIIKLRTHGGHPDSLIFQCDEEDIKRMINHLKSALIDLKETQSFLKKGIGKK